MWSRILSNFLGTFSVNRWRGCSQFWAKCTFSSTHARIWLVETFEFEAVDEGLVNFNHHFSKKLQMKSKDLNFLLNLRVRTLECKWFWRWLQIDACVWTVAGLFLKLQALPSGSHVLNRVEIRSQSCPFRARLRQSAFYWLCQRTRVDRLAVRFGAARHRRFTSLGRLNGRQENRKEGRKGGATRMVDPE